MEHDINEIAALLHIHEAAAAHGGAMNHIAAASYERLKEINRRWGEQAAKEKAAKKEEAEAEAEQAKQEVEANRDEVAPSAAQREAEDNAEVEGPPEEVDGEAEPGPDHEVNEVEGSTDKPPAPAPRRRV